MGLRLECRVQEKFAGYGISRPKFAFEGTKRPEFESMISFLSGIDG
jgi:hypothetical protein